MNIPDSVTVLQAGNGNVDIKNCIFSGFPVNTYFTNKNFTNINNFVANKYYMDAAFGNDTTTTIPQLLLGSIGSVNSVNPIPGAGSPLLSGASFTSTKLSGFTNVTYRGAFGTDNWLTSWTEFNPQNRNY